MDRLRQVVLKIANSVVYEVFALIALYLFILSIFVTCFMGYTDEHIFYLKDFPFLMCGGLLVLCLIFSFWNKKRKDKFGAQLKEQKDSCLLKNIAIAGSIILALVLIGFILHMKLRPIYDQSAIYDGAKALLAGNYKQWKMGEYFSMYPFQNGMVLIMTPIVYIFGDAAYVVFQVLNVFALFGAYLGIAKISEIYFGKRSMYMTYVGLLCVAPMWTHVTFIYGNILQMCLVAWAIYFELKYEEKGKMQYCAFSGICIAFAIVCKTNAQLFLIVVCIMLFMHAIEARSVKPVGGILLIIVIAMIPMKGIPLLFHVITGENTTNGIPLLAWMAMGLHESCIAPGWYNDFSVNLYRDVSMDAQIIAQESIKGIQERLAFFSKENGYMFRFFARKVASTWIDPALQCFTVVNTRNIWGEFSYWMKDLFYNGGVKHTVLYLLLDVLQSIHYFGIVLFLVLKRKDLQLKHAHLIVAFLGGYIYHFISETKSQYVLPYYILMVPYIVEGYHEIVEKLSNIRVKEKGSLKSIFRNRSVKLGIVITVMIIGISVAKGEWITNTVKLGGEESDYVWYCTNQLEWKDENYQKD